ncbi:gamma-glutamyltranspeptidase / glutathione hydrolase [Nitrosomonas cryotolerans]|uniref:Glutathione hydrolase proenzyme n=1 Tax=Nitrosomonas cryotolerans ATCC 49181 TaxID=1131553 RepID=A0A1N6HB36_9PROT|nr:gamma-glutamyltransferase [Nitrosomonas cryotolerans]SFQ10297.1 gamma-glutamyltranspeptidase / glutathione hydrolase [Nitrosomonas cryotolerans]SIO16865.1 gamma-glutamyltranspeptidase / glutathione hydrolase [Nitrosomonas cryotolerans ATCC 49181]
MQKKFVKIFVQTQTGFCWILSVLLFVISTNATAIYPAAIVSAHPLATKAGEAVLAQGGNAFDAAVAVSAALAVVEPFASGLGGGGFWLLHRASDARDIMIDGRETAPGKAFSGMYLDEKKKPVKGASLNGPSAAAIPGVPAALIYINEHYGQLSLEKTLAPAIRLAQDGFSIDQRLARTIENHQNKLRQNHLAARIFLHGGKVPVSGWLLRQPQLAATLRSIATRGADGFYGGHVAQEMVRSVREAGGIWQYEDLADYRVVERKPIQFTYRGTQITSASLPSAGGLTLAQGLNMLEHFPVSELSEWDKMHLIAEVLRLAYQDRVEYLGDSDFISVPEKRLMSAYYARQRAARISLDRAGSSSAVYPTERESEKGTETTHFSVIDIEGNRVAATISINTFFGSGFIAGNTGVLLNNEMDDFSMGDNVPNIFGLYGREANAILPGKRPLSSMSPTFVENENGILIMGTPGGSRIISMLLLAIIDYVDNQQLDPYKLVSRPRFHHQYLPDQIEIEPNAFDEKLIAKLLQKGHVIKTATRQWGNMQLIFFDKKEQKSYVASDPRGSFDTRY